ncbi:MAG: hypothetical protein JWM73_437 [Solirubrobacterales bacterium]|nr:hypothetical protein [Solirubrobacterales bacterium]
MPTRRLLVFLLTFAALSGTAHANTGQLSVMMDDDNLVYRSPKTSDRTLDAMAKLGVDYVRVTVLWKVIAERARDTKAKDRQFRRLGADNPKAYPKGNWDRYDHLVRAAGARGIGVYFNVTGPGPAWCCPKPPKGEEINASTWMPNAREFKLFVEAVGKRYSGKYTDENFRGKPKDKLLPRVSFWSLWNEPNQGGWLTPQFWKGKPYSPMLFRNLYIKGYEGLVATAHGGDVILLGETAPNGKDENRSRAPMYPTTFIKALFCVDADGNRQSGPGCDAFDANGPLLATAYAHHPYTKDRSPLVRDPSGKAITMANLDTLTGLLDRIAAKTSRIQANLPIALTEFGYETHPPDPYNGVSLAKQAEYSNLADLLSWSNPRVLTQTQFLLRDVPPLKSPSKRRRWFTYQSGLFFADGRPKPAAAAYALPFVVQPQSKTAEGKTTYVFWGQLRYRPNRAQDIVYFQHRAAGSKDWTTISFAQTTGRNYFTASVTPPGPGDVRAVAEGNETSKVAISRVLPVG